MLPEKAISLRPKRMLSEPNEPKKCNGRDMYEQEANRQQIEENAEGASNAVV